MIRNYLKIAWRNLWKSKTYGLINISGLAIGLAGFIIILLYLNYELSYDKWDDSLKQVYKISAQSDDDILEQTPAPLAHFLMEKSPVVASATAIQPMGDYAALLDVDGKKIYQPGGITVDSLFFKVFPYKIIKGSSKTALDKPNAIVITKALGKKLFGNSDPIGKRIKIFNFVECEVTAVMQRPDEPSSLNAQFLYRAPYEKDNMFWENYSYETYIKTKQPISVASLEQSVNSIYYNGRIKKDGRSLQDFRASGHREGLFVDAFQDLHNFPKHGHSNFTTVSVLLLLAILLLLAGAINFSNLSIVASVRRAKEVGIRKV